MGLNKKAANLLLSHGSVKEVINEYLADVAMFTLRKMPPEIQRQGTVDRGDQKVTLKAEGVSIDFLHDQRQGVVEAKVRTEPDFAFPVARRGGGEISFAVGVEDSGIKLVSKVLSHLGTF